MLFSEPIKKILEGLLFIANEPLTVAELADFTGAQPDEVHALLLEMVAEYEAESRGIALLSIAGGYQFFTKPALKPYIEKLYKPQLTHLSRAALETLAIVAYSQPVTRGEIEELRGVKSDGPVQTLVNRLLIEEIGRRDAPGRPILYGTTKDFLGYFGINSLADLPALPADFIHAHQDPDDWTDEPVLAESVAKENEKIL